MFRVYILPNDRACNSQHAATGLRMAEERPSMRDDGAWAYGPLLLPKRPEASAPSYLTPTLASHLWCLMPAKGLLGRRIWQRRYVLALRRRP